MRNSVFIQNTVYRQPFEVRRVFKDARHGVESLVQRMDPSMTCEKIAQYRRIP